ncbi:hypothetical protein JCM33374_g4608 [Metschnikowia sp. JCM 33374]|nr:hypothetical protein JCM33374_g4608 [Metschnikowia sp. JCM 33374]
MKLVPLFIFSSSVFAVAIQTSQLEPSLPSCVPGIIECECFHNTCTECPCGQGLQKVGSVLVQEKDDFGNVDPSAGTFAEATGLEKLNQEGPPKEGPSGIANEGPSGIAKEGPSETPKDGPSETPKDGPSETPAVPADQQRATPSGSPTMSGSETERKSFKDRLSVVFSKLTHLMPEVARVPQKLKTEYPRLKEEVLKLSKEVSSMNTTDGFPDSETSETLEKAGILVEMMELNCAMRSLGCADQLSLVSNDNPPEGGAETPGRRKSSRMTKIGVLIDKLEQFGDAMYQCFDDDGYPNIQDENLQYMAGYVNHEFETLKQECQEMLAQNTPLSRILDEDLNAIATKLSDLNISVRNNAIYCSHTSRNRNHASETAEGFKSDEEKRFAIMEAKLMSCYEDNPQQQEDMDLNKFQEWRTRLHATCDEVFLELLQSKFLDSPGKTRIEGLLAELTFELSRKANSVILVATTLCADEVFLGNNSLSVFSGLYGIPKADMRYIESKLQSIFTNLQSINYTVDAAEVAVALEQLRVQRALLERTSQYIKVSEWSRFPEAEPLLQKEQEVYDAVDILEITFDKDGE